MPDSREPRLLFLLPRYNAASPEHIYHLYGFLIKLKRRMFVDILIERVKGSVPEDFTARKLWITLPFLRFFEELARFFFARLGGVRLFYVHYSYTGAIAASIVTRLLGGRTYYWNCSMYKMFRPDKRAGHKANLYYRWTTFLLETSVRWCNHLVTGTPRMAEYYATNAGIRLDTIRVLPNFVDPARFRVIDKMEARSRLGLDSSQAVVLFLHNVSQRKGAHYLPGILRSLERDLGALTLLVAGDGPYLTKLKKQIRSEVFSSRIDFRHWVPNAEVPVYFAAADLYIMPSVEEGFPRVLLEAMAAGCPFVAFDVGSVRDILSAPQQECVVEAGDLDAFAAVCVQALRSKEMRDRWSGLGGERAKFFSEENVLETFDRMIRGEEQRTDLFFPEDGRA